MIKSTNLYGHMIFNGTKLGFSCNEASLKWLILNSHCTYNAIGFLGPKIKVFMAFTSA